jgi:molybdenum cofactor cytidylyltransferase
MSSKEQEIVKGTFSRLIQSPEIGFGLWGIDGLFVYQPRFDLQIIYRYNFRRIEVLGIKKTGIISYQARDKISAIVLAAGRANYQGKPLQLLPVNGVPMINRVTEAFSNSNIDELIVVLGYQAEEIKKELRGRDVKVIVNPDYDGTLSKSLRYGLKMVTGDISAVVLTLGNRPFIELKIIDNMISVYKTQKPPIIAPIYRKRRGHPVILDAALIPELIKTRGDTGGKEFITKHKSEVMEIKVREKGVVEDIFHVNAVK